MIENPEPPSSVWRLHRESFRVRVGLTIGAFGLYGITFLLLHRVGGSVLAEPGLQKQFEARVL